VKVFTFVAATSIMLPFANHLDEVPGMSVDVAGTLAVQSKPK
jgi:hypothetical protein